MRPLSLAGKHCAIVGATGILGGSIAKAFANQGAVLTLLSRTILDARPRFEPELRRFEAPPDHPWQTRPGHHRFLPLDVSSPQDIQSVFKHGLDTETKRVSETTVGPVDILVNCAGISQASLNKRTSDTELAEILNVNLLATMLTCKHAKVERQGCIINVSSLMALKGSLGAAAYAASKAGLLGFSRSLCLEMSARSVRVNTLLPGWIQSSMWDDLNEETKKAYLAKTPSKRVADPAEVAHAAIFLAQNEFANNCILNLDGGLSAT